jgi:subtilase family serine protease
MKRIRRSAMPAAAEVCEARVLLSAAHPAAIPAFAGVSAPAANGAGSILSTTSIQSPFVYGTGYINSISGCAQYAGQGETIVVVEAMHDPTLFSDVAKFEAGLNGGSTNFPDLNSTMGGTLRVVGEQATSALPSLSNQGTAWQQEEALDVEYAHLIAPKANIVVAEANTANVADMLMAAHNAAALPGVAVVSMSWGVPEFSTEAQYDQLLTHPGVTFVASAGDVGKLQYPAVSPNVIDVGGTNLSLDAHGYYGSETLASGTPLGKSLYEPGRGAPDAFATTGPVQIVSNGNNAVVAGTSLSAPLWAGMIAEAADWRTVHWPTWRPQAITPEMVADLSSQDFHQRTDGGMGSPVANYVVSDLGAYGYSGADKVVILGATPDVQLPSGKDAYLRVAVENSLGQVVTTDTSAITLGSNPQTGVTKNAVNGIATFDIGTYQAGTSDEWQVLDGWLTTDRKLGIAGPAEIGIAINT